MSIIHGSKGLIYFVHQFKPRFVEASLLQAPELLSAVTEINARVRALAPIINAPVPAQVAKAVSDPDAPIAVTTRRQGGVTYVFAVGMRAKAADATITIPGTSSGKVEVLDESRTVTLRQGGVKDHFEPYQVHLYRIPYRGRHRLPLPTPATGIQQLMRLTQHERSR